MKIVWNKVTPLSKIIALALFVALPFIGFWYGTQYGAALQELNQINGQAGNMVTTTTGTQNYGYYSDVAAWQADSNNAGFSIAYPIDFDAQDGYRPTPGPAWRTGASPNEDGVALFTLTIPRALEPQTNFADAKLTVGKGTNAAAAANCLTPGAGGGPPGTATSTAMIGGVKFVAFHTTDAGAGNFYDVTSYSALQGGKCWNIEYTIHSSQIGNYPPSYGLKPFDRAYVADILDRIVGTFSFAK